MSAHSLLPLPLETQDRILDFLHDDPAALRSCALTCRAWIASARYHVFNTIVVTMSSLAAFTHILHTSPHIGWLVENLTLDVTLRRGDGDGCASLLSSVAGHLGRVRVLTLTGASNYKCAVDYAAYCQLGPVEDLTISAAFAESNDVDRLFRAFPKTEKLSVRYMDIGGSPTDCDMSGLLPSLPVLRHLQLDGFSQCHPMSKLFLAPLPALSSLSVKLFLLQQAATLVNTLPVIGRTLTHLEISIVFGVQYGPDSDYTRLAESISACTALRSISYKISCPAAHFLDFLTQVDNRQVEHVTLDMYVWDDLTKNVDVLHRVLASFARSSNVQKITLRLEFFGDEDRLSERVVTDVRTGLPELCELGVLTIFVVIMRP